MSKFTHKFGGVYHQLYCDGKFLWEWSGVSGSPSFLCDELNRMWEECNHGWIELGDEWPELGEPVLVYTSGHSYYVGWLTSAGVFAYQKGSLLNVTHWIPLPLKPSYRCICRVHGSTWNREGGFRWSYCPKCGREL